MAKTPKRSHPTHGEGPGRHEGTEQHGWSPDVDATRQEPNPSAQRSFRPDPGAPKREAERRGGKEARDASVRGVPAATGDSGNRSGEDLAAEGEEGRHDRGPRGRSGRPSGSKDASSQTGVDPQEPRSDDV